MERGKTDGPLIFPIGKDAGASRLTDVVIRKRRRSEKCVISSKRVSCAIYNLVTRYRSAELARTPVAYVQILDNANVRAPIELCRVDNLGQL